ncbi:MAG: hypothetical protein Q8L65_06490, partial [Burkholderiales bacterium]|nr:hypothetical protein [Burkholderiales bacterium]
AQGNCPSGNYFRPDHALAGIHTSLMASVGQALCCASINTVGRNRRASHGRWLSGRGRNDVLKEAGGKAEVNLATPLQNNYKTSHIVKIFEQSGLSYQNINAGRKFSGLHLQSI